MINPGKNHLPGMLLFLDFSKIPVGFGVPDKLGFDELFTPSGAMRQLPQEGAHTVSLLFAVIGLFICLPLEGAGCRWQPLSVSSEAPTEAVVQHK